MAERTAFLSYSRKDEDAATALAEDVRKLGYAVWLDRELSGGQPWWEEILRQIRDTDVFVLALSPHSLASVPCVREYEYAAALGKAVLPALIADVSTNLLPEPLARTQFVDYRAGDRAAAFALAKALVTLRPSGPLPMPLPPAPAVPISYLGDLHKRIMTPATLDFPAQSALLVELKEALRRGDDVESRTLLGQFRQRRDLLASIAAEVDELMRATAMDSLSPTEGAQHTPSSWSMLRKRGYKHVAVSLVGAASLLAAVELSDVPPPLGGSVEPAGFGSGGTVIRPESPAPEAATDSRQTPPLAGETADQVWRRGLEARLSRPQDARALFQRALEIDPDFAPAYNSLGEIHRRAGQYGEALELYNMSLRKDQRYVPALDNKAQAFYALGQIDQARKWVAKALELNPHYRSSLQLLERLDAGKAHGDP